MTTREETVPQQLSPEEARQLSVVARTLVAAARAAALYPPAHPASKTALARLAHAIAAAVQEGSLALAVSPTTLFLGGRAASGRETAIAEAAALLHDHGIAQVTITPDTDATTLRAFLEILGRDPMALRAAGGVARVWSETAYTGIQIGEIDYRKVLKERETEAAPATDEELWRAIVTSCLEGRRSLSDAAQRRLLEIAYDPLMIGGLAHDVMTPRCTPDGSPLQTSQAAAVVAAFRHLANAALVLAPERAQEVMRNMAEAAANMDPHVVMEIFKQEDSGAGSVNVIAGVAAAFDDGKVAQLLATVMALEGQASERLAEIFNTLAPDEARKRRVLSLARHMLKASDFGRASEFAALCTSMEELLLSYNERPFASVGYRMGLDGAGERGAAMATAQVLPPELPVWMGSLGEENVRALSVLLLLDLFGLETDAARLAEIVDDLAGLAEDLLNAGDYANVAQIAERLDRAAGDAKHRAREPARHALDHLAESSGIAAAVDALSTLDEAAFEPLARLFRALGPAAVPALAVALASEQPTSALRRATTLIVSYGRLSVTRLSPLVDDQRWFVQRNAAIVLGEIAAPEAVPLLQSLVRRGDRRIVRDAVRALAHIDDPLAARAVQTALRAGDQNARRVVIQALVAARDVRAAPMLVRIIRESDALGRDHEIVLDSIAALAEIRADEASVVLAELLGRRSWFARKRVAAVRGASVGALVKMATPSAIAALTTAAQRGRRPVRKACREALARLGTA